MCRCLHAPNFSDFCRAGVCADDCMAQCTGLTSERAETPCQESKSANMAPKRVPRAGRAGALAPPGEPHGPSETAVCHRPLESSRSRWRLRSSPVCTGILKPNQLEIAFQQNNIAGLYDYDLHGQMTCA